MYCDVIFLNLLNSIAIKRYGICDKSMHSHNPVPMDDKDIDELGNNLHEFSYNHFLSHWKMNLHQSNNYT